MLQDEKIQLLEHNVTQAYAQQELVNKENKAFCNVTQQQRRRARHRYLMLQLHLAFQT